MQHSAVDVAAHLLPPNPQLAPPAPQAVALPTQQQPQAVALAPQQQQQGNPMVAVPQQMQPSEPPQVMTLAQLQQYFYRQGHRVHFTDRQ